MVNFSGAQISGSLLDRGMCICRGFNSSHRVQIRDCPELCPVLYSGETLVSVFRNILFPVDFSDHCVAIRHDVEFMARACDAQLTLLHALPPPPGVELVFGSEPAAPEIRRNARERLRQFADSIDHSVDIQTMIVDGGPAEQIVEFSKKHMIDLVMMPTRGFGVFRRVLIGSATAKVLHDLECPVWTSAHAEQPRGRIPPSIRAILCALDLTNSDEDLIRRANELAVFFSAQLRLFHLVNSTPFNTQGFGGMDFRHFVLQSSREAIATLQKRIGTACPVDVAEGNLGETLGRTATQFGADLVVIGRGHIAEPFGQFRTNAHAIVRASPCPVLSF